MTLRSVALASMSLLCLCGYAHAGGFYACKGKDKVQVFQDYPCPKGTGVSPNDEAAAPNLPIEQAYIGERITIHMTSLRKVLDTVAVVADLELVVDSSIDATGEFVYLNTPWDAILADVARRYSLDVRKVGQNLYVSRHL